MTLVGALLVADHVTRVALEAALEPNLLVAEVAEGGSVELDAREAVIVAGVVLARLHQLADRLLVLLLTQFVQTLLDRVLRAALDLQNATPLCARQRVWLVLEVQRDVTVTQVVVVTFVRREIGILLRSVKISQLKNDSGVAASSRLPLPGADGIPVMR